jgi:PAS domain-containing protein
MKRDKYSPSSPAEIRLRAEEKLKAQKNTLQSEILNSQSGADTKCLLHELQVHQIELEMQNEELQQMRAQLEAWLERYSNLYDFAPVSYFTLDCEGTIQQINIAGALIFMVERSLLLNRRFGLFVSEADVPVFNDFLKKVFENRIKEKCDIALRTEGNKFLWVHIEATASEDGQECRDVLVDITQRRIAEESLKQTLEKLRKSLAGTIQAMSLIVETRDPYTAGHQRRVSSLARIIAREMGLPDDTVENIHMAGAIHDIGKMSIPAEILTKPTRLTDTEFSLIKMHSRTGYDILKDAELPYPIAKIVLQHHEKMNGSGYPQGLKHDQIIMEARIIAVADVVEAFPPTVLTDLLKA